MPHIHRCLCATGVALHDDIFLASFLGDKDVSLGVFALATLDKALDEALKQATQLAGIMCTVYDGCASLIVELALCAKLSGEEFDSVCEDERRQVEMDKAERIKGMDRRSAQPGGRPRARATSTRLMMLVFTPLPRPSTFDCSCGILYR